MGEKLLGELIWAYEGVGEIDTSEGRGGTYTTGWYLTHLEAAEGVKDKGVLGHPGKINHCQILKQDCPHGNPKYFELKEIKITSFNTAELLYKLRAQALAKLTEDEKKALGF